MPSNVSMPLMPQSISPSTSSRTARPGPQLEIALPYPANARTVSPSNNPSIDLKAGGFNERDMASAVEHLNGLVQAIRRELQFRIDEVTGRTVIKVIDADSDEVIRQIPSDQVVALIAHLQEFASGLLKEQA